MLGSIVVLVTMSAFRRAPSIKAREAHVQPIGIILLHVNGVLHGRSAPLLTIESKHCVQSSRYTAWSGRGGRRAMEY